MNVIIHSARGINIEENGLTFKKMIKQLQEFPAEYMEHELMGLLIELKYRIDHSDCDISKNILNGLMLRVDYRSETLKKMEEQ